MKAMKSATGAVLAALYAAAFAAAYVDYLGKAGQWFADVWLLLVALPFTLAMRWLAGGSYDFSGDETARVIAAAAFCCALAYFAGALIEAVLRAGFRLATAPWRKTLEPQHQLQVLHRRARGALAEIVELGDQHRLAARLVGVDVDQEVVGPVQRLRLQAQRLGRVLGARHA